MDIEFVGQVITWRGPSPYFFVPIPPEECALIGEVAAAVTYGWGVIPVRAWIDDTEFSTSLFPKDDGYLLPLKVAVRRATGVDVDQTVRVRVRIEA